MWLVSCVQSKYPFFFKFCLEMWVIWEEELQLRKDTPPDWPVVHLLTDDWWRSAQVTVGGTTTWVGYTRKQAVQANKQHLLWSLAQFLPPGSTLISFRHGYRAVTRVCESRKTLCSLTRFQTWCFITVKEILTRRGTHLISDLFLIRRQLMACPGLL